MGVFGDVNKVELLGNITQELELRYTANGTAVTNFNIATNRSFKVGEEWQDEVTYHTVVVWGNDAQALAQRAKKGTRVYVQGRLQTRSWEKEDGSKQYKTEIVADKVILLDRYNKPENTGDADISGNEVPPKKSKSAPKQSKANDEDIIDPDDLPF